MGPHAQLALEIARFLHTDGDIAKIDFHLGIFEKRIHITGAKIADIGTKLQAGEIRLDVGVNLSEGAHGAYDRYERKFRFRSSMAFSKEEIEEWPQLQGSLFVTNAIARGLVVHEAVHAVMG
ncbi:MAG: hypothetical protein WBL39_08475, partial [Terrimicrobiaceae bacterium]